MFHLELVKWLGGNVRLWVAWIVLLALWAFSGYFLIGVGGAVIAYVRLGKPLEALLGRGNAAVGSGRYGERRYSFEDPEPLAEAEFLPRYSAPIEAQVDDDESERDDEGVATEPPPRAAPPSRPVSSVKIPPRKPVDLPRRR